MLNQKEEHKHFTQRVSRLCQHIEETLIDKHAGYGNSGLKGPLLAPQVNTVDALLVRMSDKFSRLDSLRGQETQIEALKDTCLDIIGYSMLLYMGVEDDV